MEEKVIHIAAEIFHMNINELSLETKRENCDKWDSLAHIQLISEIEDIFDCEIGFDDVWQISKLGDILKFIERH